MKVILSTLLEMCSVWRLTIMPRSLLPGKGWDVQCQITHKYRPASIPCFLHFHWPKARCYIYPTGFLPGPILYERNWHHSTKVATHTRILFWHPVSYISLHRPIHEGKSSAREAAFGTTLSTMSVRDKATQQGTTGPTGTALFFSNPLMSGEYPLTKWALKKTNCINGLNKCKEWYHWTWHVVYVCNKILHQTGLKYMMQPLMDVSSIFRESLLR